MTTMILEGGHLITPLDERFTDLCLEGGRIERLSDDGLRAQSGVDNIDCSGCYVTPGLFDLQVNGGPECSLWGDPTAQDLTRLRKSLARQGTTSFLPTLITDDLGHLKKNIEFLSAQGAGADDARADLLARMPGIHLEGPCLSPQRPGVHPPQWLQPLTRKLMEEIAGRSVSLVTLAPELEPSGESVSWLIDRGVRVSLGHSNATADEARRGFTQGIRLVTHTFNALPPLHHRAPGAVGAALCEPVVTCCIICDGLHIDRTVADLVIEHKGASRVILVTDAAQVGTKGGGLVGSSIHLSEAVRNVVGWGIASFIEAISMASYNPAAALGLEDRIGHLAPGKAADLVVWDKQTLAIKHVIVGGRLVA